MAFVVVDYSKGNLRSVQKSFELAGVEAVISADASDIYKAEAIVLPGVGAFADASAAMLQNGQMQAIRECVQAGMPFFGICLGMQLLFERGDEGMPEGEWAEGLGLLPGECTRIANTDAEGTVHKIPHVGWNQAHYSTSSKSKAKLPRLFIGIEDASNFYFTHSYGCVPAEESDVLATTTHATVLPSVVCRDLMFGVQFHPEKSSHKGLAVIKNFVRYVRKVQHKDRSCGAGACG